MNCVISQLRRNLDLPPQYISVTSLITFLPGPRFQNALMSFLPERSRLSSLVGQPVTTSVSDMEGFVFMSTLASRNDTAWYSRKGTIGDIFSRESFLLVEDIK